MVAIKKKKATFLNTLILGNGLIIKFISKSFIMFNAIPGTNYLLKVNNRNTTARCEICSKLTIRTPCSSVSIVNIEQVNTSWDDGKG